MLGRTYTAALDGIQGDMVSVEVNLSNGIPNSHIIGSTNNVVKESIERIRSTINNMGLKFPLCRITINLAPADIKKKGSHYDLPMAVALMAAANQIDLKINLAKYAFFGELSLDGKINSVRGLLPLTMCAEENGIEYVVVPYDNRHEVSLLQKSKVVLVKKFSDVLDILKGTEKNYQLDMSEIENEKNKGNGEVLDFDQVYGQETIKRAMIVAGAGGHSILLIGSPGTGKSMMAQRFVDILPPLSYKEQVEITKVHSIGGLMSVGKPIMTKRPFRCPHNNMTLAGFFGGGSDIKPGEMSYAHKGVLFLDELQQVDNRIIQSMRLPLEEKKVHLVRNRNSYTYPADCILIAAANPCKCGYRGDENHKCTCSKSQIRQYFDRLSGPFVDRIDMHLRMNPINYSVIEKRQKGMNTAQMRQQVINARKIQKQRYKKEDFELNAHLDEEGIKKYITLSKECGAFLENIYEKMALSVRGYNRILKVARTVADLDEKNEIEVSHIAEAFQYRNVKELYRCNEM